MLSFSSGNEVKLQLLHDKVLSFVLELIVEGKVVNGALKNMTGITLHTSL